METNEPEKGARKTKKRKRTKSNRTHLREALGRQPQLGVVGVGVGVGFCDPQRTVARRADDGDAQLLVVAAAAVDRFGDEAQLGAADAAVATPAGHGQAGVALGPDHGRLELDAHLVHLRTVADKNQKKKTKTNETPRATLKTSCFC